MNAPRNRVIITVIDHDDGRDDEYEVTVAGPDENDWDTFTTTSEVEAQHEAESIADQVNGIVEVFP